MPTQFQGDTVFFNLAKKYRALEKQYGDKIPARELYEATRRAWKMAEWRTKKAQYAVGVYRGKVKAVYQVQSWQKCNEPSLANRWEFIGSPAIDAPQSSYIGQPADPFMPQGAVFVVAYNFDQ